jgi:hypothetical protein
MGSIVTESAQSHYSGVLAERWRLMQISHYGVLRIQSFEGANDLE